VNEDDLTELLNRHAARHPVPGAAIGILRDGTATTATYGVADVATGEPVAAETRFSVGSLTKSMVATVIAYLVDARQLSFDDPVAAHVPELRDCDWAQRATLRDLLANRSGLPLRAGLEFGFADHTDEDDGALSRLMADLASGGPAGDFWSYTNVGWCVLGRVIETATTATWEDAMRRHLLDRADLSRTTVAAGSGSKLRASGHQVTPEGPVPVEPLAARAYGPAGTIITSTAADLLRFSALHLEDPSLAALRTVHAKVAIHGWLDAWCLGWGRFDWDGGPIWGWDGVVNGERSFLRILPEHQAAVVLMTNSSAGRAMYRSLIADLMESQFGVVAPAQNLDPTARAAGDLSRFAGVYAWPDRRVDVAATADGLLLTRDGADTEALPLNERTFLVDAADPDNPTVTFGAFDRGGRPQVLYLMLWGLPRLAD
jgi:CubicO group peptidase (beta-lactamase class C family)